MGSPLTLLLLPGLHGTGVLFAPFSRPEPDPALIVVEADPGYI